MPFFWVASPGGDIGCCVSCPGRAAPSPWRMVRLLDEAAQRILLRKVGGGYRFIHNLFRDHLATSDAIPASSAASQLSPEEVATIPEQGTLNYRSHLGGQAA